MSDGQEFIKIDGVVAFFDGCYVTCPYANRLLNHYDNLSINIIKLGQSLETSHLFTDKIERMERNNNEVKRAKIHSNGKRIVTIEKNDAQQRNYCFEEDAICGMEIRWNAEDEKGEFVNCCVILNVNSGQIEIEKVTINGEDVRLEQILELAKQDEDVLIKGEALHEFLEGYLERDVQPQKEEVIIPRSFLCGVELDEISEEEVIKKGYTPGYFGSLLLPINLKVEKKLLFY